MQHKNVRFNLPIMRKTYQTPCILSLTALTPEATMLSSSVAEALNLGGVDAVGQETEEIDINQEFFTYEWQ